MRFKIITLFPEMFPGMLGHSLAGEALKNELWQLQTIDLKQFGLGKFPRVDDTPYGGGAGLVIRADILEKAIDSSNPKKLIYLSPRGKQLTQKKAQELAVLDEITLLCGRYEGIDQRVIDHYNIEELSIGDYILSGGEPAAMVLMDSIIRLLPGVIGNSDTHIEESFTNDLLEYPLYTRPVEWQGRKVPEILTSGDHKKIAEWRKQQSHEITLARRPELLKK